MVLISAVAFWGQGSVPVGRILIYSGFTLRMDVVQVVENSLSSWNVCFFAYNFTTHHVKLIWKWKESNVCL